MFKFFLKIKYKKLKSLLKYKNDKTFNFYKKYKKNLLKKNFSKFKKVQFPMDIENKKYVCMDVEMRSEKESKKKRKIERRREKIERKSGHQTGKLFDNFYSFYLWFSFLNLMIGLSCSLLCHSLYRR